MCNCIASYSTSKTDTITQKVGMLLRAPCCWWGGCNETGGGGEWSEGGGCWHTLALEHWDMLLGAPLLRHQTQYHPRIMIEMSCSGGRPDETSILTMSPFRKTDNQGLYVRPTTLNRYSILLCCNWALPCHWIIYVKGDSIFYNDVHKFFSPHRVSISPSSLLLLLITYINKSFVCFSNPILLFELLLMTNLINIKWVYRFSGNNSAKVSFSQM